MKAAMEKETPVENIGMAITLDQLHRSMNGIGELCSQKMKPKLAIKIGKILNQINQAIEENEAKRIALCEAYGTLNEQTNSFDIRQETADEFGSKMQEHKNTLICFAQHPIRAEDLGNIVLSPQAAAELEWLIK